MRQRKRSLLERATDDSDVLRGHTCCRCLDAGFDAWLPKPFRVEDLVRVIRRSQERLHAQHAQDSQHTQ